MLHIGLVKSMLNDYVGIGLKAKLEWTEMETVFGIDLIERKTMAAAMCNKDEKGASPQADPLILWRALPNIHRVQLNALAISGVVRFFPVYPTQYPHGAIFASYDSDTGKTWRPSSAPGHVKHDPNETPEENELNRIAQRAPRSYSRDACSSKPYQVMGRSLVLIH